MKAHVMGRKAHEWLRNRLMKIQPGRHQSCHVTCGGAQEVMGDVPSHRAELRAEYCRTHAAVS